MWLARPCLMALFTASCAMWNRCVAAATSSTQHRASHDEAARDAEEVLDLAGESLERRHQTVGVGHDRQQAARQLARLLDRLVHQLTILRASAASGSACSSSRCCSALLMNAVPVRCCPRPSCRSWPMRRCSRALISRSARSRRLRSVTSVPVAMM